MPLKCCTQHVSKFGKFSSGHRTGKGQFSPQFQRRAVQNNVQIIRQLCSHPMLIRLCLTSFKLGFRSTWIEISQMYKHDLEKAEEAEINNIHWIIEKAREFEKNIYFCFIDYAKAFDCVNHNKLWKILQEMGIPDHLTCLLRNLYAGREATIRTGHGTMDWFQIGNGVWQGCILSPCLLNLYAECCAMLSRSVMSNSL